MSISFSQIFIVFIFIGGPLLLQIMAKKWTWLATVIAGYILYALWGMVLHSTSDVTEYGTGYGMLIPPYLIFITLLGMFLQKMSDKSKKEKEHLKE
ncbi:hypothetical protein D1B33_10175 [Lysinibacillus yapensis]|uniref:Uncharacterized protein n=1 Tax=Ureibacillus yapensis TaxID=2304605 RepID=A0A396S7S4_9BACL|nr:hypothetical protein [Lysinibacillus yapensis]RHW36749.1 hypothetical protein D1B33_10175 [Lysinibacillus yapensis]